MYLSPECSLVGLACLKMSVLSVVKGSAGDHDGSVIPRGSRIGVWIPISSTATVSLLMTGSKSHLLGK